MRHFASETDRLDSQYLKKSDMLAGRAILRALAALLTAMQDHGQACAHQELMEVKIRGLGKQSDDDLFAFLRRMDGEHE
eukprot:835035-Pyramimonas_sp.AAC.1